jgi:hypothetical protein
MGASQPVCFLIFLKPVDGFGVPSGDSSQFYYLDFIVLNEIDSCLNRKKSSRTPENCIGSVTLPASPPSIQSKRIHNTQQAVRRRKNG